MTLFCLRPSGHVIAVSPQVRSAHKKRSGRTGDGAGRIFYCVPPFHGGRRRFRFQLFPVVMSSRLSCHKWHSKTQRPETGFTSGVKLLPFLVWRYFLWYFCLRIRRTGHPVSLFQNLPGKQDAINTFYIFSISPPDFNFFNG